MYQLSKCSYSYFSKVLEFTSRCFLPGSIFNEMLVHTWIPPNICLFKVALSGPRQLLGTENYLKVMKKAFYFTLNALFVIKIFKFLSWIFGYLYLIRMIRLFSKFMMSQPGQKIVAMHILTNISWSLVLSK